MPALRMHASHHADATVITVAGEIDLASAPALHRFIAEMHRPPAGHLVLDLAEVPFMDSMGLRVLLEAYTAAEQHGGAVHLAAVQRAPARLLRLTRLHERFRLHASTQLALAAIATASAITPGRAGDGG
ncbi:STAS domain-containing protein [[Actinomadura] parvosata]|uniref:STAS domain-containing protein n=1 Tax=[Actinomadura] parvosata TaxID=1955412 RepID=UPI00406D1961